MFIVPELGTPFPNSFAKMLIDYIYLKWSLTGDVSKPVQMEGIDNLIEFKMGIYDEFQGVQVLTLQDKTEVGVPNSGESGYLQIGTDKRISLLTTVFVTLKMMADNTPDPTLHQMETELLRIVGRYAKESNPIIGIKDIFYNRGERQYVRDEEIIQSEWRSNHEIIMWYEYAEDGV